MSHVICNMAKSYTTEQPNLNFLKPVLNQGKFNKLTLLRLLIQQSLQEIVNMIFDTESFQYRKCLSEVTNNASQYTLLKQI